MFGHMVGGVVFDDWAYLAQQAITDAENKDFRELHILQNLLKHPFSEVRYMCARTRSRDMIHAYTFQGRSTRIIRATCSRDMMRPTCSSAPRVPGICAPHVPVRHVFQGYDARHMFQDMTHTISSDMMRATRSRI